ncbi:MAG: molybdopterin-dependent oxidoreductase, partial [Rhodospirillales bacterium]|nr:molybdopterin-dependent oxidoreductase [Rhodospirillales bacterium]
GRFGIDFIDAKDRIETPLLRRDGALTPASWEEAYAALRRHIANPATVDGRRIGGLASPQQSCETLYLFQKMMRMVFRTNNIDSSNRWAPGMYAALPEVFGDLYTRRPLGEILEADSILVVGSSVTDDNPVSDYLLRETLRRRENKLFLASARPSRLDSDSRSHLRLLPGGEASLIAHLDNELAGTAQAAAPPLGEFAQKAVAAFKSGSTVTVLIGMDLLRAPQAKAALQWLNRFLRRLRGLGKHVALQFLFDRSNQMGAWEMGVLPTHLPGWQSIGEARFEQVWGARLPSETGVDIHTMLQRCAGGGMDFLYLLGSDQLSAYPDRDLVEKALFSVDLLVVQAAHHSATTAQADIVLPGAAFGEESGTMVGNDGRIQMVREIRRPIGKARRNLDILSQVGETFDCDLGVTAPQNAFAEFAQLVPSFSGLSFADIGEAGALTVAGESVGGDGPDELAMPPRPDGARPGHGKLMLVTGDCGFHSGYASERSTTLRAIVGEAYVEILLADGQAMGLAQGDAVIVRSRRGETRVTLRLNKHFPPGVAFIPENFVRQRLNRLFSQGEYPCPVEILPNHTA